MRISDRIWMVASGHSGFRLTDPYDCHVYLIDGGTEACLIDAGGGRSTEAILSAIDATGIPRGRVRRILLTHAHADHAAGAFALSSAFEADVWASCRAAEWLSAADVEAVSLTRAKSAGGYPTDFAYPPCAVSRILSPGDRVSIGSVEIDVIAADGHCSGHLAFAMHRPGGIDVFAGDAVFAHGRILLQDIHDCSVFESCRTIERLAALHVDGLYPGHGAFAVTDGHEHIESALAAQAGLLPPPQFL